MSMYPQPGSPARRQRLLDVVAAALGGFSFLVAFLPFYTTGNNGISGYALGTPTSAAIGLSMVAGLLCAASLLPSGSGQRSSAHEQPLALAAALSALLLAVANLVSRGSLSGDVSFGFVFFLLGLFAQSGLLVYLWLTGAGRLAPRGRTALEGQGPAGYSQSAFVGQSAPLQPYPGQPFVGSQYPAQPCQGQQYPGQQQQSQQYPGQQQQDQQYQVPPYSGQQYSGQPVQGQPVQGPPVQGPPVQGKPVQGQADVGAAGPAPDDPGQPYGPFYPPPR